jgi:hypothetical protein
VGTATGSTCRLFPCVVMTTWRWMRRGGSPVRRTRLKSRTLVRAVALAMAVLVLPFAGSVLLLGGVAGAATSSQLRPDVVDAALAVSHWSGTADYPRAGYEFTFTESGSRLTYFFVGGVCQPSIASEASDNFPASVPVVHGKFAFNYIDHRPGTLRGDPGFHAIITGQITGGTAKGTLRILADPSLHAACDGFTAHWHAHNDTLTTT